MNARASPFWRIASVAFLLLVLSVVGCSEESPTGPEIDPLTGRWVGTLVDPLTDVTKERSFYLTVQAGGLASGTGWMFYNYGSDRILIAFFMEGEVFPDGLVTGEGRMLYIISDVGGFYGEGSVSGSLDAGAGTGTGNLTMVFTDGYLVMSWDVEREGGR